MLSSAYALLHTRRSTKVMRRESVASTNARAKYARSSGDSGASFSTVIRSPMCSITYACTFAAATLVSGCAQVGLNATGRHGARKHHEPFATASAIPRTVIFGHEAQARHRYPPSRPADVTSCRREYGYGRVRPGPAEIAAQLQRILPVSRGRDAIDKTGMASANAPVQIEP